MPLAFILLEDQRALEWDSQANRSTTNTLLRDIESNANQRNIGPILSFDTQSRAN